MLEYFRNDVVAQPLENFTRQPLGFIRVEIPAPVPLIARNPACTSVMLKRMDLGCSGCMISISATFSGSIEEWYFLWYAS